MREQFCLYVAQGNVPTVAARKAGYKEPQIQAFQMLKQAAVKARIEEMSERIDVEKARDIVRVNAPTREWVLKELVAQVDSSKVAGDRGATLKGLELVGREIGMFVARTMAIESPLQRLPADRLLALLALVDEAVGHESATVAPAKAIERRVEPLTIEAEAAPDYVGDNPVTDHQSVEVKPQPIDIAHE
jgi:hypothetical protein